MQWISVKDRLPEIGQQILIYDKYGIELGSLYDTDSFCGNSRYNEKVTHWMPLPQSPKIDQ